MKNSVIAFLLCLLVGLPVWAQDNCELSYFKQIKHVQVNDSVTIAYQETGKGKQTLLLIHGLGGNLSHWSRNTEELSKKYRVIALDLPNYGGSSKLKIDDSEGALVYYSQIVNAFIKKKKLKKVVLTGHSMGGQTAILTALNYPKLVAKLILVAPAGIETFTEQEAKMLSGFVNPEAIKKQNEAQVRQSFKQNFVEMPQETEALIQDRLLMPKCAAFDLYWPVIAQGVNGMLKNTVYSRLKEIPQPTLIVFGGDDALIPNKYLHPVLNTEGIAKTTQENIKGSHLEIIPRAGHLVMFEKPKEFNETIIKYLNKSI